MTDSKENYKFDLAVKGLIKEERIHKVLVFKARIVKSIAGEWTESRSHWSLEKKLIIESSSGVEHLNTVLART